MSTVDPMPNAPEATAVSPPPTERILWIDAARGLAIVLIVLLHAVDWLRTAGLPLHVWTALNEVLRTVRLPLFFLVAGLLATSAIARSWRELLSGRVLLLVWCYLLWQPIGSLTALVAARFTGDHLEPMRMALSLLATPARPRFELWFLWALALFLVVTKLLQRVPVAALIAASGVVSAIWLSGLVPATNLGWDGAASYYVFFLLGYGYRERILGLAGRLRSGGALGLVAVWAAVTLPLYWSVGVDELALTSPAVPAGPLSVPGVGLLLRLLGLAAGAGAAVALARVRVLRHLGSHTLPIYLAHTPVIVVLALVVWSVGIDPATWALVALPLAVTACAVLVSLAVHRLAKPTKARYLYRPPESLVRLIAGARGRHRTPRTPAGSAREAEAHTPER